MNELSGLLSEQRNPQGGPTSLHSGNPQGRRANTYYDELNINKNANLKEIQKAFKILSLKYHPDKNPDAKTKYCYISKAYSVLKDSSKREYYDKWINYINHDDLDRELENYFVHEHHFDCFCRNNVLNKNTN